MLDDKHQDTDSRNTLKQKRIDLFLMEILLPYLAQNNLDLKNVDPKLVLKVRKKFMTKMVKMIRKFEKNFLPNPFIYSNVNFLKIYDAYF